MHDKQHRVQKVKLKVWRRDKRDIAPSTKLFNELKPKDTAANGKTHLKMFRITFGKDLIELLTSESNRCRMCNRPE